MLLRLHGINLTPRKLHDTFSYCICSNKNYIFFFIRKKQIPRFSKYTVLFYIFFTVTRFFFSTFRSQLRNFTDFIYICAQFCSHVNILQTILNKYFFFYFPERINFSFIHLLNKCFAECVSIYSFKLLFVQVLV